MHSKPGVFGAVRQFQPKKAKESGYPADARTERYVSRAFGRPASGELRNGWDAFPNRRAGDPVVLPFTWSELVTDGHGVGGPPSKFVWSRAVRYLEHHVTVYLLVRVEG